MSERNKAEEKVRLGRHRYRRLPDAEYNEQFLARLRSYLKTDANGCWIWQGLKTHTGYGQIACRGRPKTVHRIFFQMLKGLSLRKDQWVLHRCDVPACANPAHLWLGTPKDNSQDCVRKRRFYAFSRTHCPKGHPYDEKNTYMSRTKAGGLQRNCKECGRLRSRSEARREYARQYRKRRSQQGVVT